MGERGLRLVAAASLAVVALVLLGFPLTAAGTWGLLGLVALAVILHDKLRPRPGEVRRHEDA